MKTSFKKSSNITEYNSPYLQELMKLKLIFKFIHFFLGLDAVIVAPFIDILGSFNYFVT